MAYIVPPEVELKVTFVNWTGIIFLNLDLNSLFGFNTCPLSSEPT